MLGPVKLTKLRRNCAIARCQSTEHRNVDLAPAEGADVGRTNLSFLVEASLMSGETCCRSKFDFPFHICNVCNPPLSRQTSVFLSSSAHLYTSLHGYALGSPCRYAALVKLFMSKYLIYNMLLANFVLIDRAL